MDVLGLIPIHCILIVPWIVMDPLLKNTSASLFSLSRFSQKKIQLIKQNIQGIPRSIQDINIIKKIDPGPLSTGSLLRPNKLVEC